MRASMTQPRHVSKILVSLAGSNLNAGEEIGAESEEYKRDEREYRDVLSYSEMRNIDKKDAHRVDAVGKGIESGDPLEE